MIDRQKFDETFQYYDKDVILNIIDIFETELPQRFDKIHQNILERNFDALAFDAHSLKGVTGMFMANDPFRLAKKMEELAIRKEENGLAELYEKLKSASEELLRELKEIRMGLLSEDTPLQSTV